MTTGHTPSMARARVRFRLLGRLAPALVIGLALAGGLWFGLIPAVLRPHSRVGPYDPRLVDAGMLTLNATLVICFITVHLFRRSRRPPSREAGPDTGARLRGASNPNEAFE